jgi:hypothetical protein
MALRRFRRAWPWLAVAALVLGNWTYGLAVEEAGIRAQAVAGGMTFSPNYSDLYPRWRGAYEALWQGRDPYSYAVTADIHEGLTGERLPPGDPATLADSFAYPLYFAVLLAPLTLAPYGVLMPWLWLGAVGLVALSVVGWRRVLDGAPLLPLPALAALGCSTLPAINAIIRQQPTILSLAFSTGAVVALRQGAASPARAGWWYAGAGALLAGTTIKPQCSILLLPALAIWVLGDLRGRRGLPIGFAGAMSGLLLAAEAMQSDWIPRWLASLQEYQQVVGVRPLLIALLPPAVAPAVLAGGGLLLVALLWRMRRAPADHPSFHLVVALPLFACYLVFPSWGYQQLLLYPAVVLVLSRRDMLAGYGRAGRVLYGTILSLVVLPLLLGLLGAGAWAGGAVFQAPALAGAAPALRGIIWLLLITLPFLLCLPLGLLAWHLLRPVHLATLPVHRQRPA